MGIACYSANFLHWKKKGNLLGHMVSAEMKCHHYIEENIRAAVRDIRSLFGAFVVYLYNI